jgi:two-component system, NarL family, sensor histidine kinase DesK
MSPPGCTKLVPMPSSRGLRLVMGALGLLPLVAPLAGTLASLVRGVAWPAVAVQPSAALGVVVGLLFCAFWLGPVAGRARVLLGVLAATLTLVAAALPDAPAGIFLLWAFPAVLLGFALRPRAALGALACLVTVAAGAAVARVVVGGDPGAALFAGTEMVVVIAVAGAAAVVVGELERTNLALKHAQAEIERLAVEQERTRFARDLHDLLGHTLSLMLVKLQVAQRVLPDVERASAALGDLQRLARTALEDVRDVASSYRQLTLSSEIAGAEIALEGAGIRFSVEEHAGPLPSAVEATLAWSLREAVTNVMRHSFAATCAARITGDGREVALEVRDDGRGAGPGQVESGLRTLRERVRAAGGLLEIDPGGRPHGGFTLRVRLPLDGSDRQ